MKGDLMKRKKQIFACALTALSMMLSTLSTTPVLASQSEVGSYEDIKDSYESLLNDMKKYSSETESVGLLLNVYKAAAKDISEISSDKTNETSNLDEIKKNIQAKSNSASLSGDSSSLYKEYLIYIDELIPMVKESAEDQEIYNRVSALLLNSNQALVQVISEELSNYAAEYERITGNYEDLINSYCFVRAIGQTGEDPDGNGYVFVDGKFYRYDKDNGTYMEESLNKVFDAYDAGGTLFSFYTEGGRLNIFESTSDIEEGWYDTTPWDYEQEINKVQQQALEELEKIELDCKTVIEKVPELTGLLDSIELATNEEALNAIKSPLIAFTKDYNTLKKEYAEIKEIIYSGNLNEKNIKTIDINRLVKSLENQLSQCEQLRTLISKTLTNESLSTDNELAMNKLYESLGETSSTLSKDISTFKFVSSLVGSNNEAITKASELLKEVEILKSESTANNDATDSTSLVALKKQNQELTNKVNSLASTNSSLVSKINSLTSTNSSLSSQVASLKNQSVAKAAQTNTNAVRPTTTSSMTAAESTATKSDTESASAKSQAKPISTAKTEEQENNKETEDTAIGNASTELSDDNYAEAKVVSATGVVSTELSANDYAIFGEEAADGVIDSVDLSFKDLNEETNSLSSGIAASSPSDIEIESGTLQRSNSLVIALVIIGGATVIALGSLSFIFIKKKKEMLAEMLDEELDDIYDEEDEEEAPFESRFEEHSLEGAFTEEEHMIAQMA